MDMKGLLDDDDDDDNEDGRVVQPQPPPQPPQPPQQPQQPAYNWTQEQMQQAVHDIQPGYGSAAELPTKKEWMEILEDAGNATVKAALCKYVASNPEWFFGHKLGAVKDATVALA
jgi:hypothetical protein